MDQGVAIRVSGVSKRFKLYHDVITGPIKELLFFWKREQYYKEFKAVKEVTFEIKRGEVVGIIGPNGAGKTTLLKMIAGLLPVDAGRIDVNGKVTALLTLGIGVNPEFTGRENILYGGMLLGMSKSEVLRKTPSIIEFAELGEYIDYPFRTYSSGMKSRLMFAIAMSIDPDILIVDEVLSTGDAAFVAKSSNRIKQICYSGATILFVSHNLKHIEELCPRCIVMNQGAIFFEGDTRQAVSKYFESNYRNKQDKIALMNTHSKEPKPDQGTGEIRVKDIYILVDGQRTDTLTIGKACQICIDIEALRDLDQVTLCVELFSEKSSIAYAFLLDYRGFVGSMPESFRIKAGKTRFVITLSELIVGDGLYWGNVEFYPGSKDYRFSYDTCYCYYKRIFAFQAVLSDEKWFGRGTLTEIPVKSVEMIER